jgi:energy-coupling factor transport system permease protein
MLNGFGLATYRAGTSLAHRLDGRSKIIAATAVTVAAFGTQQLHYFLVIVAVLAVTSVAAHLDMRALARSLGLVFVLLLVSAVITAWLLSSGKPVVHLGPIALSADGINLGIRVFFQFGCLIYAAQVLTLTTAPLAIATALQRLCKPLTLLRVPVDELAMLITLSLTFLPLIREQVQTVIDAQLARGVDLRRGPLELRMRGVLTMFNPIVSANLRRAGELATAMEARGYRIGITRTHLREQRLRLPDYLLMIIAALLAAGAFFV